MTIYRPKKVLVERTAANKPFAEKALSRLPEIPTQISNISVPNRDLLTAGGMGKDTINFKSFKGQFLKPCPGTNEYICCGYQILHIGTNCPLDCSYCILQTYFNQPFLQIYANLEDELKKIFSKIDANPKNIFRVGTGEFTDSLALDPIVSWSSLLAPKFSKRKNAILEFKTKTNRIEGLLTLKQKAQIVVSWSLNSPFIANTEEHGAPGIKKRLEAAKKCQEKGFVVGFHFDPLIVHKGWKEEYLKTIDLMDNYLDPKGIIWISLGSLRFMPSLKPIIEKRHPKTKILDGEFIPGVDGKMRYFKPIRIDLYSFMRETLEKWYKDLGIYLCMESDEVWKKGLGWSPGNSSNLSKYLDQRVVDFFG